MHIGLIRHIIYEAAVVATPVAGAIALLKGDKPERWGAVVYIAIVILNDCLTDLAERLGVDKIHATLSGELTATLATSGFFLLLAVRYGSLWLAAAMVVEGMDFYFGQTSLDADQPDYSAYGMEINLVALGVFLLLASGAMWSWRARIRKRKDDAKREEAANRRQEAWAKQYETLLAGRLAEAAAPAPIRNGRAHLTIEPQLP